jgi:mRNA interferase MazF
VRPLIGLRISGAILADQVKSLDWQARQVEFICALPQPTSSEILEKIGAFLAERRQAEYGSRRL